MQVNTAPKKELDSEWKAYLPIYDKPEDGEADMDTLVELAVQRKRLHDQIKFLRPDPNATVKEHRKLICKEINSSGFPDHRLYLRNDKNYNASAERLKDNRSFFALFLVAMTDPALQEEFINAEVEILAARITGTGLVSLARSFPLELFEDSDLFGDTEIERELKNPRGITSFQVPFQKVFGVLGIAVRHLEITGGMMSMTIESVLSIAVCLYRERLAKQAAKYKRETKIHEAPFVQVLKSLVNDRFGISEVTERTNNARVSLSDLPLVASRSFPPCMFHMYEHLKTKHHHKNDGRVQLGLFLKSIGMSLQDSLTFWKQEFSKGIGADRFDREYAYGVKHLYGQVGGGTNYTAYSCPKLLDSGNPSSDQCHGCPLRYMGGDELTDLLKRMHPRLSGVDAASVVGDSREEPQRGCATLYNHIHSDQPLESAGVSTPSQYFFASEDYYTSRKQE